jgi:hypothetical protein
MSKTLARAITAFVLFLCLWGTSLANPVTKARDPHVETLTGLKGVWVFVGVNSGAEGAGVTKDQLRTDVELRLRRNGIKVLTMDEARGTPGAPFFYMQVDIRKISRNLYCYYIDVQLSQIAILHRDAILPIINWDSTTRVTTYGSSFFGVANSIKEIRERVEDGVNIFSNDFLSVN